MPADALPRIGVDGFNMAMPRGSGVATYGRMLTRTLAGLGHEVDVLYGMALGGATPPLLREVVFFDSLDREAVRKPPAPMTARWLAEAATAPLGRTAVQIPVTGRVLAEPFAARMPTFDRLLNVADLFGLAERHFRRTRRFLRVRVENPPAIMHWTYPLPVTLEGARNVYTLHDLVPLRLPYATLDNKRTYLRLVRACLHGGDHVCTVSESSRRDIVSLLEADPARVTNTYQTSELPTSVAPGEELAGWLQSLFGLRRDGYLLFYGAIEPKKNIGRMIEAFLASRVETPLVIIGGRAWRAETELRLLGGAEGSRSDASGRVRMLDYVPAAWLGALVRGARAVLFPSLYEGFGLPVLEAMQAGTPVLASTAASLPEVAGDAALLTDPYDVGAMSAAIVALDGGDDLRARLAHQGRAQAARFSAEPYAARLSAMYRQVLGAPAPASIALAPRSRVSA